jgi:hypothetical protein
MKAIPISLASLLLTFVVPYVLTANVQSDREFVDEAGRYKITLTGEWRPVTYTDSVGRKKTEFVYRERNEGLLRISKESLNGCSLADVSNKELEGLKLCEAGVTVGGDKEFDGGVLKGHRLAFCYVEGNRWIAATYYFLEDRDDVWILRFTGRMGLIDTYRDMTDSMARSFFPL